MNCLACSNCKGYSGMLHFKFCEFDKMHAVKEACKDFQWRCHKLEGEE